MLNNEGQAFTEYILLVAIIVSIFLGVSNGLIRVQFAQKVTNLLTGPFAAAYQFGNVKAKGYDNGGPEYHPRAVGGSNNFRIFLNPQTL